ncbi:MAG: DUF512 domain-containing protein [Clostridia bacterium]|nr:DUF512 domain-containing protein [Clostridia bacterium]
MKWRWDLFCHLYFCIHRKIGFFRQKGENMKNFAVVKSVDEGSIAEELGIAPGDIISSINGSEIEDYFDYKFLSADSEIELCVTKEDGSECIFEIYNEDAEDLGINFEGMLFGHAKRCANKCIFCFIDQLPQGMRESLYFKDDDSRLSFLYGNYLTLTNMKDEDVNKIIRYRISPVNISVHTTNPELREKMLKNKNAGKILSQIKHFYENGIAMNFQIVLVKNVNDGDELIRSIEELSEFYPLGGSLSVVPVGLTRYREGLFEIEPFTKEDFEKIIDMVEKKQAELLKKHGTRFVYLSDEFYLNADREIPDFDYYEDFPQIENGVGMLASFKEEFLNALQEEKKVAKTGKTAIATGEIAYNFILGLVEKLKMSYNIDASVYKIKNNFFGGKVSVSGLLTGSDLINQLKGENFDRLLITKSMLKADCDVFLDDMTIEMLEKELDCRVVTVLNDGYDFLNKVLGEE